MGHRDPADQSEKRDWDLPFSETHREAPEQLEREEADDVVEDAPHPGVHGETADEIERRDWDAP